MLMDRIVNDHSRLVPTCPVCRLVAHAPLCEVDGYQIWRCPESGTDFVWPMPDEVSLKRFYDREKWFEGGEKGGYQGYDTQTEHTLPLIEQLFDEFGDKTGLSILDVDCGYGTHLAMAAQRGWKCFGVEVSKHAREVAQSRHGNQMFIVDQVENLIPHEFDLILLLDVIEHLPDPFTLLFSLFAKGAITPRTTIVITTPNARSCEAVADPKAWQYRHPPSHLVYYSAESLNVLLGRLHFSDVRISGTHPIETGQVPCYADERSSLNPSMMGFAGLLCQASGSDFMSFMHERYVPGTWSKIAEYEHMPRYVFAQALCKGAKVLDFGCGTGYGSALLATVAETVVGLDIDEAALRWASEFHRDPHLSFTRRSDLGADLPDRSFDVVTCFEMIEHVDEPTQIESVRNFARLLAPGGKLVISTPNPEVTAQYGENPFHLREMSEEEFFALLTPFFKHILMLRQWIRPSVSIDSQLLPKVVPTLHDTSIGTDNTDTHLLPLAYIAICSDEPIPGLNGVCYFDSSFDYIAKEISADQTLAALRFENYQWLEREISLKSELSAQRQRADVMQESISLQEGNLTALRTELATVLQTKEGELNSRNQEIALLKQSKLYRLGNTLAHEPISLRKLVKVVYLLGAIGTPSPVKRRLEPIIGALRKRFSSAPPSLPGFAPYQVKQLYPQRRRRPHVVHALANFMTGGSSRLVVDLIEHLGHLYEQEILTSYNPTPPAYTGLTIHQYSQPSTSDDILEYLNSFAPDLIHVHYWGDCDEPWYLQVFAAAKSYGCKVIENINTPVEPYFSESIEQYVYVSDYVRDTFGRGESKSRTIYPGSDFTIFARQDTQDIPDNTIGMVYRLENDKLNEQSIDVFVKVVKRRPQTKIIIVGGGKFLEYYKEVARSEGVMGAIEFTGYVSYEELPVLYQRISIFVAPVWKESFGQVSAFAMNMGMPVVGYDIGAIGEIIGDKTLLAPPGDSDRLATIIIDLLDDREKRLSIGATNRERAQSLFTVEAMVDSYAKLYGELIGELR